MPKEFLYDFYSKNCDDLDKIFTDNCYENNCKLIDVPNDSIILHGDNIEKCLSKGEFDNSADRIIILKNGDKDVDIVVCELSGGKHSPNLVVNKMKHTSEHIVNLFNKSDFKINKFKCCYVGQYESIYKGVIKKKSPVIKVPNLKIKNIMIKRVNCGSQFSIIM